MTVGQTPVRRRKMERDRVMDARPDPSGGQALLERLPLRDTHHVEMPYGSRPARNARDHAFVAGAGKQGTVGVRHLAALVVPLCQVPKLDAQHTGLDRIEPAVEPLDVVVVLLRLPVVAEHSALVGHPVIIGGDCSGLAARTQVLPGIKAERGGMAHRACLAPPAFLFREVFCTVRLAGVFDDNEVVSGGQLEDGVHVGHLPVQMHGNECRHRAACALAHRAARLRVAWACDL